VRAYELVGTGRSVRGEGGAKELKGGVGVSGC
jgi:hypothetical protein